MKKRCSKCGAEKSISEFYPDKKVRDGYRSVCKRCEREYCRINKERIAKRKKEHYRENKDEILKQQKEYYSKNRDKRLEYQKEYKRLNKEKVSKRDKEHYRKNKDKKAKYDKEYCRINKDKIKEYRKSPNGKLTSTRSSHNRRALYKKERSDITPALWAKVLKSQNNKCNLCHKRFTKKRTPTQDHIIPLSKGGSLQSHNIQALCKSCNSSKHTKLDNGYIQTWSLV